MITLEHLWKRNRRRCFYCGIKVSLADATRDHVIPASIGGRDEMRNLVLACQPCNQRKADLVPFLVTQEVFHSRARRNTVGGGDQGDYAGYIWLKCAYYGPSNEEAKYAQTRNILCIPDGLTRVHIGTTRGDYWYRRAQCQSRTSTSMGLRTNA